MIKENRGVVLPVIIDDYTVASSHIPYEVRCEDWTPYLPSTENQFSTRDDWMDCVSESYNNAVETQMNKMKKDGKFTATQLAEMEELNYFDENALFNFSDRFLAKMSGTTRSGNSQNAVAECARKNGLIGEKDWGEAHNNMTWDEYYAEIPQAIKDKAKKIFDYILLGYEWSVVDQNPVANYAAINKVLKEQVKHAPIQVTMPICPSYHQRQDGGAITTCSLIQPAHALMLYKIKDVDGYMNRLIFDSYPPYSIVFQNNYPIPYGLKIVCSPARETRTITTPTGQIHTNETSAFWERMRFWLKKWNIPFVDKVGGWFK